VSISSNARYDDFKATDRLPSPTGVGLEILRLTQSEDTSVQELSRAIQTDPALAGRILKLANSAQSGVARCIACLDDAVVRLGFSAVRNVALGFSLLSAQREGTCAGFNYDRFWAHSLAAAIASQMLSRHVGTVNPVDGYACGLLSRIGRLALASVYPKEYSQVLAAAVGGRPRELAELEQEHFSTDHNELGAAMLSDWGLPNVFATAVHHHEQPQSSGLPDDSRGMILAQQIHVANLVAGVCIARSDERPDLVSELQADAAILDLGDDRLTSLCEQVAEHWRVSVKKLGLAIESADPTAIAGCQSQPPSSDNRPARSTSDSDRPVSLRILVIDDEAITRRRLQKLLSNSGHVVTTAADGDEGLRLALETNPQLVISEWMLPGMDGRQLCQALRRTQAGRQMYVIMLTGQGDDDHVVEAFKAGADDHVVKPFVPAVLEARLCAGMRVLRLQEESARDKEEVDQCVAELAVANRTLEKTALTDALTDALTGLPDRHHLMERLAGEWEKAIHHGRPLACLMLNIDHFKRISDVYGRDVGDEVLRDTAQVLKKSVRCYDVPSRSGGEEFIVICPGADVNSARGIAERVCAAVEGNTAVIPNGPELRVTVSIGVADNSNHVTDPEVLIHAASEAMYTAKKSGGNRVHVAACSTEKASLEMQVDRPACALT